METASVGSSVNLHLLERYPELLFLLSYTPLSDAHGIVLHCDNISEEIERFRKKTPLKGVDILYVYGIGLGHHYAALKSWLKEKRERRLIFLEDELAAIDALLYSEHAEELLNYPQVLLQFIAHPKKLQAHLQELVATYP